MLALGGSLGRDRISNNSNYKNIYVDETCNDDDDSSNMKYNNDNYKNSCIKLKNERRSNSDNIDNMYHADIWKSRAW